MIVNKYHLYNYYIVQFLKAINVNIQSNSTSTVVIVTNET